MKKCFVCEKEIKGKAEYDTYLFRDAAIYIHYEKCADVFMNSEYLCNKVFGSNRCEICGKRFTKNDHTSLSNERGVFHCVHMGKCQSIFDKK